MLWGGVEVTYVVLNCPAAMANASMVVKVVPPMKPNKMAGMAVGSSQLVLKRCKMRNAKALWCREAAWSGGRAAPKRKGISAALAGARRETLQHLHAAATKGS